MVFISDRSVDYLVSQCEYKQGKLHMVLNNGGKDVKVVSLLVNELKKKFFQLRWVYEL